MDGYGAITCSLIGCALAAAAGALAFFLCGHAEITDLNGPGDPLSQAITQDWQARERDLAYDLNTFHVLCAL